MSISFGILSIVYYLVRESSFDPVNGYLPYKIQLPFDVHSYKTWMGYLFFSLFSGSTYALLNVLLASFLMAVALHFKACRKHFDHILQNIDAIRYKRDVGGKQIAKQLIADAIILQNHLKR